jgi:hypothetical protein
MKKIIPVIFGILLLLGLTGPVFSATAPEPVTGMPVEADSTPVPTEEYVLPYPGILQDNPLYFLKTVRDRIMEWMIADPLRKIDFYVLQSDKNLNAGLLLNLANKKVLVPGVLTQSYMDIEKAVSLAATVKNSGGEIPSGQLDHILRSLKKHQEVFTNLNAESLVTKAKSLEETISKLR